MILTIGLPKTGTSSLAKALEILGYRASTDPHNAERLRLWCDGDFSRLGEIDVQGEPAYAFWRQLAEAYPLAQVIVTERPIRSWIRSCAELASMARCGRRRAERFWLEDRALISGQRLTGGLDLLMGLVGGGLDLDGDRLRTTYTEHVQDIARYFRGSDRLLAFSVFRGEGWRELCRFLGRDEPPSHIRFPHLNIGKRHFP